MSLFNWQERPAAALVNGGVIAPDERLPWPQTAAMGVQHVIAMFGATVLAPILMGFDPNLAIFMSGVGTLLFYFITGGQVPSYLGSSFAFIGVVIAATGYGGQGPNANIPVALGAIIVCGLLYALIGALVNAVGTRWIERLMPPVVTGAVVAVIGLNLAAIPIKNMAANNFEAWMQALTFVSVALVAVFTRGMVQRLLILVGLILASIAYAAFTNGLGWGKPVDLSLLPYWEVMGIMRWAVIALMQAERHLSGEQPSLELALTGRMLPEIELDLIQEIQTIEKERARHA